MADFSKAFAVHSTTELGKRYTEDAVRVNGDGGQHFGREAIEKWFGGFITDWDEGPIDVDVVRAFGSDVIVAIARWSGIYHGQSGPVPMMGGWDATYVRDRDTWKVKMITTSDIPVK